MYDTIKTLQNNLLKDKDLWYNYQSNIAMCIYDRYLQYGSITENNLHQFCNDCADDFLNLFTQITED